MKYELLNKIVLSTCELYLDRMAEDKFTVPTELERLKRGIITQRINNPLTNMDVTEALEFGKDKKLQEIMNKEISFMIFIMELMKVWTMSIDKKHRPILNVGDKHFKLGGKALYMQMLQLRGSDTEKYNHKKAVIDDSIIVAQQFFEWHWKKLELNK